MREELVTLQLLTPCLDTCHGHWWNENAWQPTPLEAAGNLSVFKVEAWNWAGTQHNGGALAFRVLSLKSIPQKVKRL